MEETFKNYAYDLGVMLKELGIEAAEEHRRAKGTNEESHRLGYLMGFHRVLTLMQQQAEEYDIALEDLGMKDFDADSDLI